MKGGLGGGTPKIVLAPGTSLPPGVRIVHAGAGTGANTGGQRLVFLSSAPGTSTTFTPTATIISKPAATQPTATVADTKTEPSTPKKIPQLDGADDEEDQDLSNSTQSVGQESKQSVVASKPTKSTLESALLGQGSATPSSGSSGNYSKFQI